MFFDKKLDKILDIKCNIFYIIVMEEKKMPAVCLLAFVESEYSCCWMKIWSGETLRQLSSDDFDFFKKFYGLKNLSLSFSFEFENESSFLDDPFWE